MIVSVSWLWVIVLLIWFVFICPSPHIHAWRVDWHMTRQVPEVIFKGHRADISPFHQADSDSGRALSHVTGAPCLSSCLRMRSFSTFSKSRGSLEGFSQLIFLVLLLFWHFGVKRVTLTFFSVPKSYHLSNQKLINWNKLFLHLQKKSLHWDGCSN